MVEKCSGKSFFFNCYTMLGQQVYQKHVVMLSKKMYFGKNKLNSDKLSAKMMCFYNSGPTLKGFLKFCKMKELKST